MVSTLRPSRVPPRDLNRDSELKRGEAIERVKQGASSFSAAAGRGFQIGKEKVDGASSRVGVGIRDVIVKPEIILGKGKDAGLIVLKWIIILVLLFVSIYFLFNWNAAGGSEKLIDNIKIWSGDNPVLQFFVQGLSRLSVESLSGDVWTGEVDQNINENLGVKILEFRPYQDSFFPDDPIRLFGDIEVASLAGLNLGNGDKQVKVSCGLDEVGLTGTVIPDHFNLYPYYEVQVDCSFENPGTYNQIKNSNEIKKKNSDEDDKIEGKELGKSTIASLDVVYDFVTKSYLNVYLMDEKERMALRSKGVKDILNYYNVNEKQPILPKYTNGPVEIGIGVGRGENVQPLGVIDPKDPPGIYAIQDTDSGEVRLKKDEFTKQLNKKYLGITVKNKWDGEIVDLNLKLLLPKDMSLDSQRLKKPYCPFVQVGKNVEWCKKIEDSRCYEIDPNALKGYYDVWDNGLDERLREAMQFFKQERSEEDKQLFYPIKDFRTFYCFVDIGPEAYKQFTKVTYLIEADYKYHVSEDRTITFKDVDVDEGSSSASSDKDIPVPGGDYSSYPTDTGCDIKAPRGTSVYAVKSGTVIYAECCNKITGNGCHSKQDQDSGADGCSARIRDSDGNEATYFHMSKVESLSEGQSVTRGQKVGEVGVANNIAHLHLGVNEGTSNAFSANAACNYAKS